MKHADSWPKGRCNLALFLFIPMSHHDHIHLLRTASRIPIISYHVWSWIPQCINIGSRLHFDCSCKGAAFNLYRSFRPLQHRHDCVCRRQRHTHIGWHTIRSAFGLHGLYVLQRCGGECRVSCQHKAHCCEQGFQLG